MFRPRHAHIRDESSVCCETENACELTPQLNQLLQHWRIFFDAARVESLLASLSCSWHGAVLHNGNVVRVLERNDVLVIFFLKSRHKILWNLEVSAHMQSALLGECTKVLVL